MEMWQCRPLEVSQLCCLSAHELPCHCDQGVHWRCWWSWDAGAGGLRCGKATLGAGPLRSVSAATAQLRRVRDKPHRRHEDGQLWGAAASPSVLGLHVRAAATTCAFRGCWGPWVQQAGAPVIAPWQLLGPERALSCLGGCHVAREQCQGWDRVL